ncbi:hypothetical protein PLESTF_000374700 [Pleodorina starrii]|nr:hypothetical protein PLESTM_000577900 [Pleodorina starrii]GLC66035.1 hypothetical protein PLESTF_000374700 [Pleodorina starrii]
MSTANIALVPLASVTTVPANGYTGSSTEYWALSAAQARELQRVQDVEKARIQLRRRQRIFTWMYNILAIGELVYFIVGLYITEWQVADLQENPLLGPGREGVIKMGGTYTQRIVKRYQYWRLVSSLFYNAGAIHVTSNLGMVWAFGHLLVRELSPWLVALMFFGGGMAGLMVSVNVGAQYSTAGASIPAFALAGAASAMLVYRWRRYSCHWASVLTTGFMVGANAFMGATPFVDNSGNTAGFVFGAVLCLGFMMVRRKETGTKAGEVLVYGTAVVAVAVILAAIVAGLAGLQLGTPVAGCCNPWVCTSSSWWDCNAARIWPDTCTLTISSGAATNTTSTLTCPHGNTISVNIDSTADADAIQALCDSLCVNGASAVSSGGASQSTGGDTSLKRRW